MNGFVRRTGGKEEMISCIASRRGLACWLSAGMLLAVLSGLSAASTNLHDPENFASGATVRVSSEIEEVKGPKRKNHPATEMIDGRVTGGYWTPERDKLVEPPHWAEVDLNQEQLVGRVAVWVSDEVAGGSIRVEGRHGSRWVELATIEPQKSTTSPSEAGYWSSSGPLVAAFDPPRRLRHIRFVFDAAAGKIRIHEIKVMPPAKPLAERRATLAGHGPVLKFDFGGRTSSPTKGWLPVNETTRCASDEDYGWRDTDGLVGVDREDGFPLIRSFVAGLAAKGRDGHSFLVKTPNGKYAVAVVTGDPDRAVPGMRILAQGQVVAPRVGTGGAGGCDAETFVANVTDGTLEIRFESQKASTVTALIVAPLDRWTEVQAAVEQLEDQFVKRSPALLDQWRERKPDEPAGRLRTNSRCKARGYEVFTRPLTSQIFPSTVPAESEVTRRLQVRATPGEYEAATLAVRAFRPLRNLRLSVDSLQGDAGAIPADRIDVKVVRCWPQVDDMLGPKQFMIVPELLEPQGRHGELWVRPDVTRQFWLTIHVPDNAKAGKYQGKLSVEAADAPAVDVALEVEVLPFHLHRPPSMAYGIYYYPNREDGDRLVLADLRNIREHGLNNICFTLGPDVSVRAKPDSWDFGYLRWLMGLVREVGGFDGPFPVCLNCGEREITPKIRANVTQLVRELEAERKKQGWPEFLYYPIDEPFRGEKLEKAVPYLQACKEVPGIRTYATVSALAAKTLAPWLDVRCHSLAVVNGFVWPDALNAARADGDTFWWYSNATRHYFTPMRLKSGFFFWNSRATGEIYWQFRDPGKSSPFCDFDGEGHDHIAVYPGLDGPIETIQWECYREGINDSLYAYTLERMVAECEKKGVGGAALIRAKKVLKQLSAAINMDIAAGDAKYSFRKFSYLHYICDWTPGQFEQQRHRLADAIVELSKLQNVGS
ncbi:MAG: discoidin domain-containing protein [Thermoguttaceae bacterium]